MVVGEFTPFDDSNNIYENPRLNPPTLATTLQFWKEPLHGAFGLYIPVTYTVWSGLARATYVPTPDESNSHLDPHVFHAVNVLAHALVACAVFALLLRMLRDARAAALGAAVFALHPLQVEAVGWVSGLKDVLSGLFCIIAVTQYLAAAQIEADTAAVPPSPTGRGKPWRQNVLGLVSFVAAMLCKPTAMVTPALLLALDVWFLRRPLRRIVRALIPWVLLAIPFAAIARVVQDVAGVPNAPLWARPFVAGDALAFYLWKMVSTWPLIFDYELYPELILRRVWGWVAWVVPVTLFTLAWRFRRRQPLGWVATLLFVIPLLPNSGLATFQYMYYSVVADHYLYVAMLGPALLCAWMAVRWTGRQVYAAGIAVVLVLLARTIIQAGTWNDHFALTGHALKYNPDAFMAHGNLGFGYDDRAKRLLLDGKIPEAREAVRLALNEYETAARLRPDSMVPLVDLVSLNSRIRDFPAALRAGHALVGAVRASPERAWRPALEAFVSLATDPECSEAEALFFLNEGVKMHPSAGPSHDLLQKAITDVEARQRAGWHVYTAVPKTGAALAPSSRPSSSPSTSGPAASPPGG